MYNGKEPGRAWRRRGVVLLVCLLAGAGSPATGVPSAVTGLYVAPDGSDTADGLGPATALATLERALRVAGPGTTVNVLPGVYRQSARVSASGAPGSPIRVIGSGRRTVFDGGRELRYGLWLEESAWIELRDLEFRDYTDIGLLVVLSSEVSARGLRVHGNGFDPRIGWVEGYGIHLDESTDLLLERSRFWDNGPDPRPVDEVGTGINVYGVRRAVIRANRSFRNHGGGILVEDSFDVLVKRNRIEENDLDVSVDDWWDAGVWVDGGARVRVIANRIRDNLGPGIEISDEDCQDPVGYVLRRNVSNGNYFGIFVWNFGSADWPPETVLKRRRNEFTGNSRQDVWIEPDLGACRVGPGE